MRILCPKCERAVDGADIDLASSRALCKPCGELFALPDLSVRDPRGLVASDTYRPSDLEWSESIEGNRARFKFAPSRLAGLGLLAFATIWNGFFLVLFYIEMAHSSRAHSADFFFPLPYLAVGLFITWLALSRLLNWTYVSFEDGDFVVRQGPIPARSLRCAIDAIDGFDVGESRGSKGAVTWKVRVLTKDGEARWLPLSLGGKEHTAFAIGRFAAALSAVRMPLGYRDEPMRFRAPPPSQAVQTVSDGEEAAPPADPDRGRAAR